VTALWSDNEDDGRDEPETGLFAALLHAIDLRRLGPYHARAEGDRTRDRGIAPSGGMARIGVWLPDAERRATTVTGRLQMLIGTDDSPPRAALAFALGVFIGCTPLVGLHALIALGLAFLLGLNRIAMLAGTFVNNPWTLVPITSAAVWIGTALLGVDPAPPRLEGLATWTGVGEFLMRCRPFLLPLFVGALALGALAAAAAYPVFLVGLRWYRSVRRPA
jgi:hypothetical protein